MNRLSSKHRLATGVLLIMLVLLLFDLAKRPEFTKEFRAQELTHFENLEDLLKSGIHPTTSYAAASLSKEAMSKLFDTLGGIEVKHVELPDVTLTIGRLSPIAYQGLLGVRTEVNVAYRDIPIYANLSVDGYLLTRSIGTTGYGSDSIIHEITYGIAIRAIKMYFSNHANSIQGPKMTLDMLLPSVNNLFSDLEFSFPIALPAQVPLEFHSKQSAAMGDGSFEFEISMPRSTLDLSSKSLAASIVPASKGIWLIVFDGLRDNSTSSLSRPNEAVEEEGERLQSLRDRVNHHVSKFPEIDHDTAVYINQIALRSLKEVVNALPKNKREITANLLSQTGHLWKTSSTLIGQDGEISVRFTDPDSATARAQIGDFSYNWIEGAGMSMKNTSLVTSTANLTLRVDPYIGGGVSIDFDVKGEATVPFEIFLDVRKINLKDGTSGIVGGPVLKCKQFPIEFTTGKTLELGMITYQYVGKDQIDPHVLMSSESVHWFSLSQVPTDLEYATKMPRWVGIQMKPRDVHVNKHGYIIYADLQAFASQKKVEPAVDVEITERAMADEWISAVKQKCPEKSVGKVLIAGQDFGPNNDLVKVLSTIVASVSDSVKLVKLTWEDLEEIKKNPEDTPKILARTVGNFIGRTVKFVDNTVRRVAKVFGISW